MDRDCENCIHKVNGACNSWGCKFEPKSEIYRPCSKCHNEECVFMGGSDTHSLCEDFEPKFGTWIPVSERLPEVNQKVLVTSYGRVCYAMMTSVDGNSGYPIFRLQDGLNERVICETTVHSEFTTSRITAWMPLPEPYNAESEE